MAALGFVERSVKKRIKHRYVDKATPNIAKMKNEESINIVVHKFSTRINEMEEDNRCEAKTKIETVGMSVLQALYFSSIAILIIYSASRKKRGLMT